MKDNESNKGVHVIKLGAYALPQFKERRGKQWIDYGKDNLYPLYLVDLMNQSAIHNAIIKGKVKYIVGKGLTIVNDALQEDEAALIWKFVQQANKDKETLNDILRKIALDLEIHNGFALEIIRGIDNEIKEIYHVDFSRYRISAEDENVLLYSENWENRESLSPKRIKNNRPDYTDVPKFDREKKQKKSVYYYVEYRPDLHYYPLPEYIGAVPQIESSVEIANFDLNTLKNGFAGGTLFALNNGMPKTKAERDKIVKDIKDEYAGTDGQQVLVTFSDDKEHGTEVHQVNGNDLPDRYMQLEERVRKNIFIGHSVTSTMLFGDQVAGKLGSRDEMTEAFEIFKRTYIDHRQRIPLQALNDILEFKGLPRALDIEELPPIEDRIEISQDKINAVLSDDMVRDELADRYGLKFDETNVDVSMSAENNLATYLIGQGVPASDYTVIKSFPVEMSEEGVSFKLQSIDDLTPDELEELRAEIANILETNPNSTAADIAALLEIDLTEAAMIIGGMEADGLLTRAGALLTITAAGQAIANLVPSRRQTLEIKYRYEERPDAAPAKKSRPFCQRLMSAGQLYTREQIEGMRNNMTQSFIPDINDVWKYRGGWYQKPDSPAAVPFCRHRWVQVVVQRK